MYRPDHLAFVLVISLLLLGCQREPMPEIFIARVGDQVLTHEELASTLETLPSSQDTLEARQQIVEQWVTNALLFQEAQRLDLRTNPEVQRLLAENEKSVLISAYLKQMYEENVGDPQAVDVEAYFEQNREQLRLRERFVHVRYLATATPDSANLARSLLQRATQTTEADSVWALLAERFAEDADGSLSLSRTYFPEARLFLRDPPLKQALQRLRAGQIAPIIQDEKGYHLLQLIDRVRAGTAPELAWIEYELKQRLVIQARKQMYARQVQRLRSVALAREALEIQ